MLFNFKTKSTKNNEKPLSPRTIKAIDKYVSTLHIKEKKNYFYNNPKKKELVPKKRFN
jgi:hypothetical protein